MSASSTWRAADAVQFTQGSTTFFCTDCEFNETHDEFNTTNNQSGGYHEFGVAKRTYEIRGTAVIDTSDARMPTTRTLTTFSFTDGSSTFSGSGRILTLGRRGGGEGGATYPFTGKFTGTVTVA